LLTPGYRDLAPTGLLNERFYIFALLIEITMKKLTTFCAIVLALIVMMAFTNGKTTEPPAQVEGHYVYVHAFDYDLQGYHLDVHESGTMDFFPDGTAVDSAAQMYSVMMGDSGKVVYVFNYVSPSRWNLDGEDFYFSGIKESFRMELVDCSFVGCDSARVAELAQDIIKVVSGSIDYKYKFHLDSLTDKKMQWSFTYRDGHSDTWKFFRKQNSQSK
jgi:hypothetical protein